MKNIIKWYSDWQWVIVSLFGLALAAFTVLPFMLSTALLPLVAFVHRFSVSVQVGSLEKTLTILVVVAPIIVAKAGWDWWKHGKQVFPWGLVWLTLLMFIITNIYGVVISDNLRVSLINLLVQFVNYGLFIGVSWWLFRLPQVSPRLRRQAVRWFVLAFVIIILVNVFVSWSQFVDCSVLYKKCRMWDAIELSVPSKLLPVGHQVFSHRPLVIRTPGLFGDVNFNGAFMMISLLLIQLVASYSWLHKRKWTNWLIVLGVLVGVTFILTASRSGLLSWLVVQIPLTWYLWRPWWKVANIRLSKSSIMKWGAVALGVLIVITIGVWALVPTGRRLAIQAAIPGYLGRVANIVTDDSAQTRFTLWRNAVTLAQECSWMGCGLGTFSEQYQKQIDPTVLEANPHSSYVLVLVELGIPGLIALVLFLGSTWWMFWHWLKLNGSCVWKSSEGFAVLLPVLFLSIFPFYSVFSLTYYGLFLPMIWWWGQPPVRQLDNSQSSVKVRLSEIAQPKSQMRKKEWKKH